MAKVLKIDVEMIWGKENPNMSICKSCNDVIYSNNNVLHLQVGRVELLNFSETDIKLCDSCYKEFKK